MVKGVSDKQLQALLAIPPEKRRDIPDGTVDGLAVRVGPRGKPTWTFRYRVLGAGGTTNRGTALNGARYHRVALGRYPAVSIRQAREKAAAYLAGVERGEAPHEAMEEAAVDRRDTVRALVEDYVAWAETNIRSWRNAKWSLERHIVGAWAERPAGTITEREAAKLVNDVARGEIDPATGERKPRPGAGAEVRKWGSMVFEWGRKHRRVRANPFADVEGPRLQKRQRWLTKDEVRAVWKAAGTLERPWSDAIRLLMLTACRENEICKARWSWLDAQDKTLVVPPEHYKTNRPFLVPLTPEGWKIIEAIPRLNGGDHIFSTTNGLKPIFGVSRKIMDELHRRAEAELKRPIDHFRLHDLRRTARTHLSRLGVSEIVGELVLGHALKGVQGTYNVYDFAKEKREALCIWASELAA